MDRAFDILLSLQRGTPGHEKWVVQCLKGSWDRLVGERLAAVCRPMGLEGSVLQVEVVDDGWMHTICSIQAELENRLRSATCGEVRALAVSAKKQEDKCPTEKGTRRADF